MHCLVDGRGAIVEVDECAEPFGVAGVRRSIGLMGFGGRQHLWDIADVDMADLCQRQQGSTASVGRPRVREPPHAHTEAIRHDLTPQSNPGAAAADDDFVIVALGECREMRQQPRGIECNAFEHSPCHVCPVRCQAEIGETAAHMALVARRHRADEPWLEDHAVGTWRNVSGRCGHTLVGIIRGSDAEAVDRVHDVVDEDVQCFAADAVLGDEEEAIGQRTRGCRQSVGEIVALGSQVGHHHRGRADDQPAAFGFDGTGSDRRRHRVDRRVCK